MSEDKVHAKFSPSSAFRWLNCPGSIRLSIGAPKTSNKYADEGTTAHTVFECAVKGSSFVKILGKNVATTEMINHASESWKTVQEASMHDLGMFDETLVESKVVMDHIHPEFSGTVDLSLVAYGDEIWVIDYKYGAGYAVEVKDNPQLISYAIGILRKFRGQKFKKVILAVAQPRAYHEEGPFRTHEMEINEVKIWEKTFKEAIKKCEDPKAPTLPGGWCRWCPASTFCPSISTKALSQAQADFSPATSEVKLPDPNAIKDLGKALTAFTHIRKWMNAVEDLAFKTANDGKKLKGWKLVQKRGTRKWINPKITAKEAKEKFGKDAFTLPELLSPAQLEKIAGEAWIKSRVEMQSSGLTLVEESDKREETTMAKLDFDEKKGIKNERKNGHKTKKG